MTMISEFPLVLFTTLGGLAAGAYAVSYTHLDVYKRQAFEPPHGAVAQRKRAPYVGHRQAHGVHLGMLAHLAFQHHVVEPAHQPRCV